MIVPIVVYACVLLMRSVNTLALRVSSGRLELTDGDFTNKLATGALAIQRRMHRAHRTRLLTHSSTERIRTLPERCRAEKMLLFIPQNDDQAKTSIYDFSKSTIGECCADQIDCTQRVSRTKVDKRCGAPRKTLSIRRREYH
jgi:hypothetical protein